MHLIQLLLPLRDNDKQELPAASFESVHQELTDRFGGVTAFLRSPAVGLWKETSEVNRDEVVMLEVMTDKLDTEWWANYRDPLERRFRQDEILIWSTHIEKL